MKEILIFQPLDQHHDRAAFVCHETALEEYLHDARRALREQAANIARVTVLINVAQPLTILAYFTLSATSVVRDELPSKQRRLSPYRSVPAMMLGRMAVDDRSRGQRYGSALILKAFRTCLELASAVGFVAMIVDANNDDLVGYYQKHEFISMPENRRRLFIPIESMRAVVGVI